MSPGNIWSIRTNNSRHDVPPPCAMISRASESSFFFGSKRGRGLLFFITGARGVYKSRVSSCAAMAFAFIAGRAGESDGFIRAPRWGYGKKEGRRWVDLSMPDLNVSANVCPVDYY